MQKLQRPPRVARLWTPEDTWPPGGLGLATARNLHAVMSGKCEVLIQISLLVRIRLGEESIVSKTGR